MKSQLMTIQAGESAAQIPPLRTIRVIDLVAQPGRRDVWRSRGAAWAGSSPSAGLPDGGHASPMGFWLAGTPDPASLPADALRLTLRAPGEPSSGSPEGPGAPPIHRARPNQTVRVKGLNSGDGDLILSVGPGGAQVVAGESAWQTLAEPVLLAVCQYWRFCAVDAEIDRLTELAFGDIGPATMPGPAALRDGRRLAANAQAVRALLVDLPHFEGPLTDPLPYCSSERSAQVYRLLSEKLHLEEWCEAIDEHAEAIEDTYEAVIEKLFEYRNFAWEAILEAVIILILVAELAVMLYETFTP